MSGKKTKLKKMKLTSVDMVRRGANQEAYINLYKSEGDPAEPSAPPNPSEVPDTSDIPQGLWKSIVEAVKGFLKSEEAEKEVPEVKPEEPKKGESEEDDVEKSAETFENRVAQQEIRDNRWKYLDALNISIESILTDNDLSAEDKRNMMNESIDQFSDAYKNMCYKLLEVKPLTAHPIPAEVGKSQEEIPDNLEEGEEEMRIDKSRFTPEELANYNELIAKGRVDDEPNDDPEVKEEKEMHPEVKKALEEVEVLKKNWEMKEMRDIAKKYSVPLGKKEDELANTLYEMKKSSEASFNEYIAVLDQSLDLVNKSGIFEEIGKSGNRGTGYNGVAKSEPEAMIEGIAKNYMEKDPSMDYDTAVMKAWENNPELMKAYDAQY